MRDQTQPTSILDFMTTTMLMLLSPTTQRSVAYLYHDRLMELFILKMH
uniref:Uncharacterized protein n=1 Tax=Arundo donax TaxID=35708 RepID=A0A0A9CFF8_ARUDO